MIFENINIVSNKEEFLEKILIYIRLVEVTADYNGLVLSNDVDINNDIIKELIAIGVIAHKNEVAKLETFIKPLYQRFINCIAFYLSHKRLFGHLLDRLNNSKRKELQASEGKNNKPTFVDFFAGAGGLGAGGGLLVAEIGLEPSG